LIGTSNQLLEFFLLGSSTFESHSIGHAYNTTIDGRDLQFTYSTADDQQLTGIVRYLDNPSAAAFAIPEPVTSLNVLVAIMLQAAFHLGERSRRRLRSN
jgi:hypothetical protein